MAIAGKGGSVNFGGTVAEMSNWSLDVGVDEIDTSNFDSSMWKEFIAGLKEWSGSFEGNLVKGHKAALFDKLGQEVQVTLSVTGDGDTLSFSGTAFLTSLSIDVPYDDKAGLSADFRGTGELTPSGS